MKEVSKLIRNVLKVCCLITIDLLSFVFSLFLGWVLRSYAAPHLFSGLPPFEFSFGHFLSLWWLPSGYIFFMVYEGLYTSSLPFWDETRETVKAVTLATVTIMAVVTLGKMGESVSRFVLSVTWLTSLLIFPLFRLWGKRLLYASGIWRERVLILGAGNASKLAARGLSRETHMGYEVVGFLDDDPAKKGSLIAGKKVFGRLSYFPRYISKLNIQTVLVAIPSLPPDRLSTLTAQVQNYAVNTLLIPDLKGIALLNTELRHLFSEEIFLMHIKNNLKSAANRAIKRLFDLLLCLIFFPFLLPVIGLIAVSIRLETRGPAVYAHDRVGKGGKTFRCYKFRTMRQDAEDQLKTILESSESLRSEWEKNWKLRDDPRVTRIGSFLRKTSLDELPQLLNVVTGAMSLVGPRPYLPREKAAIGKESAVIWSAPPGITGLWQVSGRSNTTYDYRIKLDAWYVRNWSLWLDIVILFKTVRVVLRAEGAY